MRQHFGLRYIAAPAILAFIAMSGTSLQASARHSAALPASSGGNQDASKPAPPPQKIDKKEEAAYKAFHDAPAGDQKIQLGEQFDQKYPNSRYSETVEAELVSEYYQKQDWTKFYGLADKVIQKDPDNATVLTLVGWVIPRVYDPNDPSEPAKLDESERYEKHAIEVIQTMPKPAQVSDADFAVAKDNGLIQAHSGLGLTYFRRQDYEDSAKELEQATQGATPDPTDLFVLGTDLQNLNRASDAADAFSKCGQIAGALQDRCKQQADAAKKAAPAK